MPYDEDDMYNPIYSSPPPPTPFDIEEDFVEMVEVTTPPADSSEPPLSEQFELFGNATERLDFLLANGPNAEYYRRWPERKPSAEAAIEKARTPYYCRGCGRAEWPAAITEGYCSQCWHHLGRKEVA